MSAAANYYGGERSQLPVSRVGVDNSPRHKISTSHLLMLMLLFRIRSPVLRSYLTSWKCHSGWLYLALGTTNHYHCNKTLSSSSSQGFHFKHVHFYILIACNTKNRSLSHFRGLRTFADSQLPISFTPQPTLYVSLWRIYYIGRQAIKPAI